MRSASTRCWCGRRSMPISRRRACLSRPGGGRRGRPPAGRRGHAARHVARASSRPACAGTPGRLRDRGHRIGQIARGCVASPFRSAARRRRDRVLALRRGEGSRRCHPGRAQADGARVPGRDLARRSACSGRQHGFRTSPRAARFPARRRQAQVPAARERPRRRDALRAARRRRLKTLVVYLMSGSRTPELAAAAVAGGADIVELGFPFSDPLADGPVIRRAAERALAEGMRTRACLECLERTHELLPEVPLVPMTYAALLEAYGWDRFATDARDAGASSMIVADLPAGERPELKRIQLVAPTSTDERLRIAADDTDGWLSLVTVTGTTGARADLSPALAGLVKRARAVTDVPLYAGFGISTPDHARAAAQLADGIVVGSRAVEVAESGPEALRDYVRTLREGVDSV